MNVFLLLKTAKQNKQKNWNKIKQLHKLAVETINTRRGIYSPNKEYIIQERERLKKMLKEIPADDPFRNMLERRLNGLNRALIPFGHLFRSGGIGDLKHEMHLRGAYHYGSTFERDWYTKKPVITSPKGVIYDENKKPIKSIFIGDNKSPLSLVNLPNNYKLSIFNFPKFQTAMLINDKNYGNFPCVHCGALTDKKFNLKKFIPQKQKEDYRVFHGVNFDKEKHGHLIDPIMEAFERKRSNYLGGGLEKDHLEDAMRWFEKHFKK